MRKNGLLRQRAAVSMSPGIRAGRGERVGAGAAIFEHGGFGGPMAPAEQPAFVDRMQRVDEDLGAAQRQTGRDTALAQSRDDFGFGHAGEPRLGQPCRQCGEGGLVHGAIIPLFAARLTRASIEGGRDLHVGNRHNCRSQILKHDGDGLGLWLTFSAGEAVPDPGAMTTAGIGLYTYVSRERDLFITLGQKATQSRRPYVGSKHSER